MSAAPRVFGRNRLTVVLLVAAGGVIGCTAPDLPDSGPLGPGPGADETLDPLPPADPTELPPAQVGRIKLKTVTTGQPIGGPGWVVNIDRGPSTAVGLNSTVVVHDVPSGDRLISLDGLADNCALSKGNNPRRLTVVPNLAAQTEFHVACNNPGPPASGD